MHSQSLIRAVVDAAALRHNPQQVRRVADLAGALNARDLVFTNVGWVPQNAVFVSDCG